MALFADANFFSANTPSAIRANSGLTQATPTQSTSYQLQSWLNPHGTCAKLPPTDAKVSANTILQ
jgi:hypothetical protein